MIVIYDAAGAKHPLSGYTNYHIRHMADGEDRLSFYLDTSHEQYQLIREEGKIEAEGNDYLVKKIDNNKIDCVLDFDFLKARTYTDYRSETRTLLDVLTDHLPEGWTIEGAEVSTIRRTISFDACTDYDIISQCQKTYSVRFIWHIQDKRIEVIDPDQITPTGEYITSELNLQSLSFKGETTSFATRLYAYGADGMTMEDAIVDGERYGKTYVENHEFSDKVVCAVWKDERYTIPANLFNDATEKLALLAKPVRSYKCRVLDLAKQDPRYSFLTFSMWRKITLIDVERKLRVEHQIVQYDEYPEEPDRNDVTLSCVPETIHDRIKATAAITEDGKAKIFVTQPAPPYDIGDLWVQGPDGEIMRCRIKRTAGEAFDLDDWILASKYTDDTYAEAVQADLDQYKIDVSATLEVHEENIEARVTKTGGESSSFAWIMTDAAHTWYANSAPVMAVSKDGLTVNGNGTFSGEIRASKGYIGGATGFEITSQAIRNGMESRDDTEHNGVYIGTSGIALGGGKFKVTSTGAVTAKSLDLTGGSIRLGDDGNGNPVFAVTNQGAVTAKNLTLTGGSINIGDRFKVSTSGYLTADFTGGSITLGKDSSNNPIFQVTSGGVVTAKSLNLTGGSISLGDDGNGNPVFRVTNQGAVTAKNLTLTGGSINIGDKFKVSTAGVLTADMTGGSITLGDNFAVTNAGAVTAKNLTLTGGSIALGDDGQGKPVFQVTNQGAVTAKNLTLTGGSINIGDKFKVSTTGVLTADMTGGSITLGDNFAVTNQGAVTAKNLTLTGGSISLGSDTDGNPVFRVTNQGAVTAKNLTLTGGSINIGDKFKVSSTGVLTADMTGGSITLGNNFAVTNSGAVTAKDLTLTGGSISLGSDGSGNPVFNVTSSGAVTARNLALTGGSINIKDENGETAFSVSSTGAVTASKLSITGGSISIGNAFTVDEEGNIRASSGYFGGSVMAENIKSDAVHGEGGSLSGSALTTGTVTGGVNGSGQATGQLSAGVVASLGYANAYNSATQVNTGTYPAQFTAGGVYGNFLFVKAGGQGAYRDIAAHTHEFTEGTGANAGKVFIGAADLTGAEHSFKIADTKYYKDGVSAAWDEGAETAQVDTVSLTNLNTHETSGSHHYAGVSISAAAKATKADGSTYTADPQEITEKRLVLADQVWTDGRTTGHDEGAETAQVDTVSITANGIHIKSGSHHYTRTTVKATAKGTKADGSTYKAAEQTISTERDVNADAVYADGKTDYEPTSILVTRETADADISWNATQKKLSANFTITAKNAAGIAVLDSTGKSISIPATKAFDAGQDYGAGTVVVLGTDSLTVTTKNAHKTSGQHHYVNVDVIPTARATKSNGTYATATNTINRDINADTVYSDGVSAGYNSGVETAAVDAVSTSSNDDHETSGSHHYVTIDITANAKGTYYNGSKYTAGSQSIASGRYILADAVYSAGYTAGAGSVSQRDISSVDEASYSTSADFSVVFDDAYLRYTNGYLRGRASIALTDGSSSTVFIEMDGNRAYNSGHSDGYSDGHSDGYSEGYRDGAGSVSQRTISSIGQTSYSSNADFSFAFDYAYLRYSDGFLKGRASISFSDGSSNNVFIEMDGARAYDTGKSDGYSEGYTNGHSDGYSDGWSAKSFYFAGVSGTYSDTEILLYVYENGSFVTSYWVPYQGTFD